MRYFAGPLAAFVASAVLTAALSRYRGRWAILDHPNERSLHVRPRPRSGGVAVLAGLAAGLWLGGVPIASPGWQWAAAGVLTVAAVSLIDDVQALSATVRLPVHLVAASAVVLGAKLELLHIITPFGGFTLPAWTGFGVSILYLAWMLNLYNFMDGIDGLAAGMAVWGFAALGALGWHAGTVSYAIVCFCTAAAALGFLPFNFAPARIFMGDVGAGTLGLLAGVYTLWGARIDAFPVWAGVLVFSPFIVDATWTLLRRAFSGEPPWQAHRAHAYQRLVRSGWTHRRTALWEYAVMFLCAVSAILAVRDENPVVGGVVLLGWTAVYLALGRLITKLGAAT